MTDEDQIRALIEQMQREKESQRKADAARYIPEEYRESVEDDLLREFEDRRKKKPIENMPYRKGGDSKTPYMQKMPYRRDSDGGPYIKKL